MEVEELYHHLLRLVPPWRVERVVAEAVSAGVLVYLEQAEVTAAACPLCGRACAITGKTKERSWRHLNTCQRQTRLFARLALADCPEHGEHPAAFPLAEADAPVTFAFAQWVRQLAKSLRNVNKLAEVVRLDSDLVERILSPPRDSFPEENLPGAGSRDKPATGAALEQPRQLGLFAQNDMILINQGLRALRMLQPEQALEFFRRHRQVYPNGPEVASKIALAEFLLEGMVEAPPELAQRIPYRCRFWSRFREFARTHGMRRNDSLLLDLQKSYFESILREFEQEFGADTPMLLEGIPSGYLYLQAGQIDRAIQHLQALIPQVSDHAALYGYLGDAYWLRGESKVARQCYREGCLIAPAALDWWVLRDDELKDLLHDLQLLYGFDEDLAAAWLPSHARLAGIFERKAVRLNDGLKELVNDYIARQKALAKQTDPIKAAELFFRGMILCENEDSLRLVKKVDPIQVRRLMKQTNPDLFAEFLATVVAAR